MGPKLLRIPRVSRSSGARRFSTLPSHEHSRPPILWTYIPQPVPYEKGLLLQEKLVRSRLDALDPTRRSDLLILLQHKPVYTAGRRERGSDDARAEKERLQALWRSLGQEADYVETLRGGQTTFHGPGQLVGYPILHLGDSGVSHLSPDVRAVRRAIDPGWSSIFPSDFHPAVCLPSTEIPFPPALVPSSTPAPYTSRIFRTHRHVHIPLPQNWLDRDPDTAASHIPRLLPERRTDCPTLVPENRRLRTPEYGDDIDPVRTWPPRPSSNTGFGR